MKDRIKWMLVGLGFTFGLQVILSLIYTGIAFTGTNLGEGTISLYVLGITLGTFFVGGFVIGWMSEELRIGDAVIVAVSTLVLSALIYLILPESNKPQFVTGLLLSDETGHLAFAGRSLLLLGLSLIAATVGAYSGWHVKVPQEGMIDRVALVLGLVGAVVGPFVLLAIGGRDNPDQPNLPWYFLVIVLVLLLVIIGVGFVMFTRESTYDDEISISPDHHRREV